MRVISYKRVREFIEKHPDCDIKIKRWYKRLSRGNFDDINGLKKKFPDVDYIGNDRFVFNISGNRYRIVALINFCKQKVFIRFIGTHTEYDRIDCLNI